MDRIEIKRKAREITKENLGNYWKAMIIVIIISILLSIISIAFTIEESPARTILNLLGSLIQAPLNFGLYYYFLNIVRKQPFEVKDVFKYVKFTIPIIILSLITGLFIFLWSLLFIIPGIIAAISYTMIAYIYIDGEEEPMECIKKSKEMMQGYKMDYFIFGLSFLGWIILGLFTFGLLYIWVIPYYQFALTIYYDELKKVPRNNLTNY